MVGNQIQVLKHLPEANEGERGGSKGYVRKIATARGAMEKVRPRCTNFGKDNRQKVKSLHCEKYLIKSQNIVVVF